MTFPRNNLRQVPVHPALSRIFGALWPLLFVPLVVALIKSGKIGPYESMAFEIGEPLGIAAMVYAGMYCVFWLAGADHTTSAVTSAIMTLVGLLVYVTAIQPI